MDDLDEQPADNAAVSHGRSEPAGKPSFAMTDGGGADPTHQHLFHLAGAAPSRFDGGDLRGAVADNWSVLKGQQGSVYLARLAPGGVREPHWQQSAWEMNFVVSKQVRWSLVGVPAETFEAIPKNRDRVVIASKKKEPAND